MDTLPGGITGFPDQMAVLLLPKLTRGSTRISFSPNFQINFILRCEHLTREWLTAPESFRGERLMLLNEYSDGCTVDRAQVRGFQTFMDEAEASRILRENLRDLPQRWRGLTIRRMYSRARNLAAVIGRGEGNYVMELEFTLKVIFNEYFDEEDLNENYGCDCSSDSSSDSSSDLTEEQDYDY